MGVTGLWRLIEPSGTPVPLQTLDNKVLAVDVSIWLHQAIKGFQNSQGGTLPNAHLLGIYHRICKLLFFGIKPVVIFDGGVPNLKRETINKRANKRSQALNEADTIQKQLVSALLKHTAISKILSEESITSLATKEKCEDIYKLPPTDFESTQSSEDESSTSFDSSPTKNWDLHTIDEKSAHFKSLPVDIRHDILTDLKETRKQSSWGKIHEMPKKSDAFSGFQMKRLLKRYSVQVSLEEVEKEMGGRSLSLAELEALLNDQGVLTCDGSVGKRIASDENKRYFLIKDLKKAMDQAKKAEVNLENIEEVQDEVMDETKKEEVNLENKISDESIEEEKNKTCDKGEAITTSVDAEFEDNLKLAIELSLQDVPSTSTENNSSIKKKRHNFSFLQDFDDADFGMSSESEEDSDKNKNANKILASAKNYMVEYSGLTPNEIAKIMSGKSDSPTSEEGKLKTIKDTTNDISKISTEISEPMKVTIKDTLCNELPPTATELTTLQLVSMNVEKSTNLPSNLSASLIDDGPNKLANVERIESHDVDASSDSSNDFVDVFENQTKKEEAVEKKSLEIVIVPDESLENDLFSDIFCEQKTTKILSKPNLSILTNSNDNLKNTVAESVIELSTSVNNTNTTDVKNNQDTKIDNEELKKKSVAGDLEGEFLQPTDVNKISGSSNKKEQKTTITREELKQMQEDLEERNIELITDQLTKERMANSLTDQIIQETQDLLQMFGIPYITAPMEAEAQCAFLEIINLTDGTITDDSDIWLFGGKTVYKNFFNQQKHVMEFRAERIQEHYKLSREQMILLALLVGSDYTVGIQGIGPVTALEILGAFPPPKKLTNQNFNYQQLVSGLEAFRKWLNGERTVGLGRTALKSKLKNVTINEGFPNLNVIKAYLEPSIDSNKNPFSWGKPNINGLIEYARKKFGWTQDKSENILKPVLKKSNELQTQKSIKDYFKTKHKIGSGDIEHKMSKRVKKAVNRIENGVDNSEEEKATDSNNKSRNQVTTTKGKQLRRSKKVNVNIDESCGLSSDEDLKILKNTKIQSKTILKHIHKEVENQIEDIEKKKARSTSSLHKREVIPQKQKHKADALRSKIKAIEVFRKSKKGPGFVPHQKRKVRAPKADAELSESSSD